MVITLCNQKGGSGKTTLTLLLALALEDIGHAVCIVDRDPQQSATHALANLRKQGLSAVQCRDSPSTQPRTVTLIDTPPQLNKTLAAALSGCDRALLVSQPSPADLWSTQGSRTFLETHLPKTAKCAILFNSVLPRTRLAKDLAALAGLIGLPALKNCVTRRQPYQYAILQGWGALKSPERDEIKNAVLEIIMM